MTDGGVPPGHRALLAALTAATGAVHLAMTPSHMEESGLLGAGFALAAGFQLTVVALLLIRPRRSTVVAGAVGHAALAAAWVLSRTTGLPIGGSPEGPGTADLLTVSFEILYVLVAAVCLTRPVAAARSTPVRPARAGLTGVVVLGVGGLTGWALASPGADHRHHQPGDGVELASGGGVASATPPGHGHGGEVEAGATEEQVARAEALLADTKASLVRWSDHRAAEADGFRAIQGPSNDLVHFVNLAWVIDDRVADPRFPESLVYRSTTGTAEGYALESAMFVLPRVGYPLPDIGGPLTPWHAHEDLCFRLADAMIVGSTRVGPCPPGSANVETPDMLHVWVVDDHPGGPFAGLGEHRG